MTSRRFFPLDRKLRLRADHWSEGAAGIATRQGLQAKSFERAAAAYREAVGGEISADSVQRLTEGWGVQVEARRVAEAECANTVAQRGETPRTQRVPEIEPIQERANLSTDEAMVLVRGEGWKEVKLTAISAVTVKPAEARPVEAEHPSHREGAPLVELSQHSYQAGLWDADTMELHQYADGVRRGLDHCERLSSVNDGADWIERITQTNFARAVQIVDWSHASGRLWDVGKVVWGEGSAAAKAWVELRLDALWTGQIEQVVAALEALPPESESVRDVVRQATGYFRNHASRMHYAEYRAAGYPIGSGTVESAANTVVHDRMKRPGRGWQRGHAQAMLAALGEFHSDRFDHAWQATLPTAA